MDCVIALLIILFQNISGFLLPWLLITLISIISEFIICIFLLLSKKVILLKCFISTSFILSEDLIFSSFCLRFLHGRRLSLAADLEHRNDLQTLCKVQKRRQQTAYHWTGDLNRAFIRDVCKSVHTDRT